MNAKTLLIADLHKVLFTTAFASAPDNLDLATAMAMALINHHGLYFKEKNEVHESEYWNTDDVQENFFDHVCPGRIPSITHFEYICEQYFDWSMWEATRQIGSAAEVMGNVKKAIDSITAQYDVVATAEGNGEVVIINPVNKA